MALKQGPNVLLFTPNRAGCILLVSVMVAAASPTDRLQKAAGDQAKPMHGLTDGPAPAAARPSPPPSTQS
jgi:hypothetical protein